MWTRSPLCHATRGPKAQASRRQPKWVVQLHLGPEPTRWQQTFKHPRCRRRQSAPQQWDRFQSEAQQALFEVNRVTARALSGVYSQCVWASAKSAGTDDIWDERPRAAGDPEKSSGAWARRRVPLGMVPIESGGGGVLDPPDVEEAWYTRCKNVLLRRVRGSEEGARTVF